MNTPRRSYWCRFFACCCHWGSVRVIVLRSYRQRPNMEVNIDFNDMPIEDVNAEVTNGDEQSKGENGLLLNNEGSSATKAVDDRLKRKAKRPSKYLMKQMKDTSGNTNVASHINISTNLVRIAKNLRRPRNGYGRGLPKKGNPYSFKRNFLIFQVVGYLTKQPEGENPLVTCLGQPVNGEKEIQ